MKEGLSIVQRRLVAVDPWTAAGPGWANSGVTAIWEETRSDGSVRLANETVYQGDLSAEEVLAWRVGMAAMSVLRKRFEK